MGSINYYIDLSGGHFGLLVWLTEYIYGEEHVEFSNNNNCC